MAKKNKRIIATGSFGGEKVFVTQLTKKEFEGVPIHKLEKKFKGIHDDLIASRTSSPKLKKALKRKRTLTFFG